MVEEWNVIDMTEHQVVDYDTYVEKWPVLKRENGIEWLPWILLMVSVWNDIKIEFTSLGSTESIVP